MAIEFINVRTNEKRVVETPEHIAAFFNSSDKHVNALVGQDHGWRLAPAVVVRLKKMREDGDLVARIAAKFSIPSDEVKDYDLLRWISMEDAAKNQPDVTEEDHTRQYEDEIRALEDAQNGPTQEQLDAKRKADEAREADEKAEREAKIVADREAAEKQEKEEKAAAEKKAKAEAEKAEKKAKADAEAAEKKAKEAAAKNPQPPRQ